MRFVVRKGLDLKLAPPPAVGTPEPKSAMRVALLGRDFPGLRFDLLAHEGARVRAGEPLLRDRRRPEVVVVSPAGGTVAAVNLGARRALVSLEIDREDEQCAAAFEIPARPDREALRALMLASGTWTALRKRPFGIIPDPQAEPRALLITATDSEPLAPDPVATIVRHAEAFSAGVTALTEICESPVYLCQASRAAIPVRAPARIKVAEFTGPHPAGLPGTHIHALCPIGFDAGEAWHIGYQDVISFGHLLTTGTPWLYREISLAGPAVSRPRMLSTPLGASIKELVAGELEDRPVRLISGSALSGQVAAGTQAYLGQRHNQLTALPEAIPSEHPRRGHRVFDTGLRGTPGPLIAVGDLDRVAPPGILAVPLLRALLVGDVERARDLGALELVEEDLALLSYVCPSKTDYGPLLRDMLDQLREEES